MIDIMYLQYDSIENSYIYKGKKYKKMKTVVDILHADGLSQDEAIKQIQLVKKRSG
jgi:hypothetical protein